MENSLVLKTSKACQDTYVPTKIIKENADIFANVLFASFNAFVEKFNFPCMYVCKIYLTSVKNAIITKSSIHNTNLNRPRQILFVTS